MTEGVVRWWNCDSGFGFIAVEGQPDVFVHHLALAGQLELCRGQRVAFDVIAGQVGSVAANVQILKVAA